jgi:hypothetical protein
MDDHKSTEQMEAEFETIEAAVVGEIADNGIQADFVITMQWPCGCAMTKIIQTAKPDTKVH